MSLSTSITFQTYPSSPEVGNIVFLSQDSGGTDDWAFYVQVTDPTGAVIQERASDITDGNYECPVDGSNDPPFLVPIPLDANGNYLSGDYKIEVWIRLLTHLLPPETEQKVLDQTYTFCAHNTPLNTLNSHVTHQETLSCVTGLLTATDTTDYEAAGYELTGQELTIDPPPVDGRPDVVDTAPSISITVEYTNVDYGVMYRLSYTYNKFEDTVDPSFTIVSYAGAVISVSVPVTCQNGICSTLACLYDYFNAVYAKAQSAGGWSRLTPSESGNFNLAMTYVNLASMQLQCGNVDKYNELLLQAKALIEDCGCGCTDCNTPQPFVPQT